MTTYAFCLGVNSYRQPIESLKCAERDARDLAAVLEHGLGFEAEYLEERKTEDIEERIENLESCLQPGDQFIFYFSGHGKAHGDDQYFLLPGCRYESLEDGHAVTGGVLSWNTLKRLTSRPKWRGVHRVFIFDACRTPLVPVKGAGERPSFDGRYLLRDPRPTRSDREAPPLTLINSCDEGTCAIELPGRGNGVFTTALMEHLKETAQRGMDVVLNASFVNDLHQRMSRLIRENGLGDLAQSPAWRGDETRLTTHKTSSPKPDEENKLNDDRLWKIACAEGTLEAYKEYVRNAPRSAAYIKDALARIAAITKRTINSDTDAPSNSDLEDTGRGKVEINHAPPNIQIQKHSDKLIDFISKQIKLWRGRIADANTAVLAVGLGFASSLTNLAISYPIADFFPSVTVGGLSLSSYPASIIFGIAMALLSIVATKNEIQRLPLLILITASCVGWGAAHKIVGWEAAQEISSFSDINAIGFFFAGGGSALIFSPVASYVFRINSKLRFIFAVTITASVAGYISYYVISGGWFLFYWFWQSSVLLSMSFLMNKDTKR